MNIAKQVGIGALAVMALMAVAASSSSATTLEVGGVTQNQSVTFTASLKPGTSLLLKDTFGLSLKTCTTSHLAAITAAPYTGSSVTGPIETLTFANCTREVVVHKPGKLEITWTSGTNGSVALEEAEITTGSPIGTINCTFGPTTKIGTLTGVAAGHAHIDVNAVIGCSGTGTTKWEATYTVTSPLGLGVSP